MIARRGRVRARLRALIAAAGPALGAAACDEPPRLPECDAYLATLERLANCAAVPPDVRGTLATSALSIRRALASAADADDRLRGQIRSTCRAGNQHLETNLALRMPACGGGGLPPAAERPAPGSATDAAPAGSAGRAGR